MNNEIFDYKLFFINHIISIVSIAYIICIYNS